MIKDASSKFDDYSVSPKIRQILLHWGYELTEKKMSYYFFNRKEILQNAEERYSREKTADYYSQNKKEIK